MPFSPIDDTISVCQPLYAKVHHQELLSQYHYVRDTFGVLGELFCGLMFSHASTVTTVNFDPKSLVKTIPAGARAYVKSVTLNGQIIPKCHFDFYDVFKKGGVVVIEVTASKTGVNDCGGSLPDSISTGGWSQAK